MKTNKKYIEISFLKKSNTNPEKGQRLEHKDTIQRQQKEQFMMIMANFTQESLLW